MINQLGKILVVVYTGLSLLFVAIAIAFFVNPVDLGWKSPRYEYGERIAAEIDKRVAAVRQAAVTRSLAARDFQEAARRAPVAKGQPALSWAEAALVKYMDGDKIKMAGMNLALKKYFVQLEGIEKQVTEVAKSLEKEGKEQEQITKEINALTDEFTKKVIRPGLFDLLEGEKTLQKEIQREIADIRPVWVQELVDAQLLLERRRELEARRDELKAKLAAAQGK
jgi:hypothetical protein